MLTYENFVAVLLGVIEQTDMNISQTREVLDTHALGRSLFITCLPQSQQAENQPLSTSLQAQITFDWSPEFTVLSLHSNAARALSSLIDERIQAQQAGIDITIHVTYVLPLDQEQTYDLAALPKLTRDLYELYSDTISISERPIHIETILHFEEGKPPRIQAIQLKQAWPLGDALFDLDLLTDMFHDLCAETIDLLEALAEEYVYSDDDAELLETPPNNRHYLKPPTA
jgi:hypothetical protein